MATMAATTNYFPIVLVHGFGGWGRDELFGARYWGGVQGDIEQHLVEQGYTVFTATVGPFSSNWDRACELYAQIKGGQVDYGLNHSTFHNHARFGRTFPGLYKRWGDIGPDGISINKVHLIGHSMGGQTIRMLTQLLEKGSKGAPVEEDASAAAHPLFTGGKHWVHSITTIATPNQGTLLADVFRDVIDEIKDAIVTAVSTFNVFGDLGDKFYDAKLDQWGISRKRPDESLEDYMDRLFSSRIFTPGVQDVALWSLSSTGAKEENTWVETLPSIYYFSYVAKDTYATRDGRGRNIQKPNFFTMFFALKPLGAILGSRLIPELGFSEEWQANDGVVNSFSMRDDSHGKYVPFKDVAQRGVWNGMPTLEAMDHIAVVGLRFTLFSSVLPTLYGAHAKLLYALPTGDEAVTLAHQEQQQIACDHVHKCAKALRRAAISRSLRAQAVAIMAAKTATRGRLRPKSEQEQHAEASRITSATWEGLYHKVPSIPEYAAEPPTLEAI